MARVRRSFRFEKDLAARYESVARELGQTNTVFVERALEAALKRQRLDRVESEVRAEAARQEGRKSSANFGAVRRPYVKPFKPQPKS